MIRRTGGITINNIKIAIIGNFAIGRPVYGGQIAKTRDYFYYLSKRYGEKNIVIIDTSRWKYLFPIMFVQLFYVCCTCNRIVLLLNTNGRKLLLPVLLYFKNFFCYKILFSVVGGSICDHISTEPYLLRHLNEIDAIYVETKSLVECFKNMGYCNVHYLPVFTHRQLIKETSTLSNEKVYKFCTYSRVCKEKGISDAIDAIVEVNKILGSDLCSLDIYGPPVDEYKNEFLSKSRSLSGIINNKPLLVDDNAINVLSEHYALLFPTWWPGEGFPIALIESMKAGLPIIATDWHYNAEIVHDGQTGIIYPVKDKTALVNAILKLVKNPKLVMQMKKNCIEESKNYEPETVLSILFKHIDDET